MPLSTTRTQIYICISSFYPVLALFFERFAEQLIPSCQMSHRHDFAPPNRCMLFLMTVIFLHHSLFLSIVYTWYFIISYIAVLLIDSVLVQISFLFKTLFSPSNLVVYLLYSWSLEASSEFNSWSPLSYIFQTQENLPPPLRTNFNKCSL